MKTYTSLFVLGIIAGNALYAQEESSSEAPPKIRTKTEEQSTPTPRASAISETQIITANRVATDAKQVGKSYTIISQKEIQQSTSNDLLNILRRVPGLHFAENGPHGTSSIFIRGNEGYHTKVLYNGVPIEDAAGTQVSSSSFLNSINLDNVERIEIIRGAQSVLYGSDAIGGVINIITKRGGAEAFSGSVRQEFGANKYSKSTVSVFGSEDKIDYSFGVGHESENTFSATNSDAGFNFDADGDAYRNTSGNGQLSYYATDQLSLSLSGNYINSEIEYDQGELQTQAGTIRPEISITELLNGDLDTSIAYSLTDTRRSVFNTGFPGNFESQIHKYEWMNTYRAGDMHTFTFGVDFEEQEAQTNNIGKTTVEFQEYYLQDHIVFNDIYSVTAGARFIHHSQFGDHAVWQISPAAYFASTDTRLHASAGTGFRAPSVNELFGPFGNNPDLLPEESESYDLGIEQGFNDGKIKIGLTGFYNTIDDAIIYSNTTFAYDTVPHIRTYGLESFVSVDVSEDLYLKLVYTRLHTEGQQANDPDTRLVRRPKDSATFLANYQATDKLNLNLELNYNSDRPAADFFSNDVPALDAYFLTDFAATYEISKQLKVFGRIENLLDEDYEYARGYNTRERTYFAGLEYSF